MTQYIEPYTPNLVPQGEDVLQLARFLSDEFQRIETAIRGASVQASYGGLTVQTPQTGTANIVPRQITEFSSFVPAVPNRVRLNAPGFDSLTPEENGVYVLQCQFTVNVDQLTTYRITADLDGSPSPIFGEWETSNQQFAATMTFSGMLEIEQGQELSVLVQASADASTYDIQSGIFMLYRISELRQVRT